MTGILLMYMEGEQDAGQKINISIEKSGEGARKTGQGTITA